MRFCRTKIAIDPTIMYVNTIVYRHLFTCMIERSVVFVPQNRVVKSLGTHANTNDSVTSFSGSHNLFGRNINEYVI